MPRLVSYWGKENPVFAPPRKLSLQNKGAGGDSDVSAADEWSASPGFHRAVSVAALTEHRNPSDDGEVNTVWGTKGCSDAADDSQAAITVHVYGEQR
ncbi:hypothetical protein SKAU_G00013440 [Synaphobranchus kaupii]|uniref:Uncharacterized protein n=1 Tax=Synaphobranchus kaupii TaxID=118154 RepID=A0A9Q1GAG3_SYNKA|nr:hypothetical protein SKAU_G00013440 [Synaphobranchus kaupii]